MKRLLFLLALLLLPFLWGRDPAPACFGPDPSPKLWTAAPFTIQKGGLAR